MLQTLDMETIAKISEKEITKPKKAISINNDNFIGNKSINL